MLVAGSQPIFEARFTDQDGAVVDITGFTVELRYSINNAAAVTRTATVTDGPGGIAQYQTVGAELTQGEMVREWRVTDGASNVNTSVDKFEDDVRAVV